MFDTVIPRNVRLSGAPSPELADAPGTDRTRRVLRRLPPTRRRVPRADWAPPGRTEWADTTCRLEVSKATSRQETTSEYRWSSHDGRTGTPDDAWARLGVADPAAPRQPTRPHGDPDRPDPTESPISLRHRIDDDALATLIASVREHGIIQPILVTETIDGYQLVAGERRLRAAVAAGLDRISAVVRQARDREQLELALVENLQREDLGPIEAALAYRQLIDEFGFTHEVLAERVGRARSTVANTPATARVGAGHPADGGRRFADRGPWTSDRGPAAGCAGACPEHRPGSGTCRSARLKNSSAGSANPARTPPFGPPRSAIQTLNESRRSSDDHSGRR